MQFNSTVVYNEQMNYTLSTEEMFEAWQNNKLCCGGICLSMLNQPTRLYRSKLTKSAKLNPPHWIVAQSNPPKQWISPRWNNNQPCKMAEWITASNFQILVTRSWYDWILGRKTSVQYKWTRFVIFTQAELLGIALVTLRTTAWCLAAPPGGSTF